LSEQPRPAAGQVSADGQFRWDGRQWVPIPKGEREPTPWTRPMQLAAAALFAIVAVENVVTTLVFVNHDSILKAIKAQGTTLPVGTDVDTVVNIGMGVAIATAIVIAVLALGAAAGSMLGWRWMFWVALVLFGLGGLSALASINTFSHPDQSPVPLGAVALGVVLDLAGLALFVWMLVGAVKYGPWAMKRPGARA
jgi:hypothetical protein